MKKMIFTLALTGLFLQSFTLQTPNTVWKLDKSHSSINFAIDHLIITETKGEFNDYIVSVKADKPDFTDAHFDMNIRVSSINTKDSDRDKHLISADFFDTEKYPEIVFKGKKFIKIKGNEYKVIGDLTMHGVTKSIMLNARFGGIIKDPWGGIRAGVNVWGEIDRYDFGLKYNSVLEAGGKSIGQVVRINCSIELIKE